MSRWLMVLLILLGVGCGDTGSDAVAGGDPFGTDSNTAPNIGGMPNQFYIGRIGVALTGSSKTWAFSQPSALAATPTHTFGYWGLNGPFSGSNPNGIGTKPYDFGYEQGEAAATEWANNPAICGRTVFADIEPLFEGWVDSQNKPNPEANAQVLDGFLDAITDAEVLLCDGTTGSLVPGVYFNSGKDGSFFDPAYLPSQPFVFWGTGKLEGVSICWPATNDCLPGDTNCDTLTPVIEHWSSNVSHACFAGQGIVLWQFWISDCGCAGDFDYTPQATQTTNDAFVPVSCD